MQRGMCREECERGMCREECAERNAQRGIRRVFFSLMYCARPFLFRHSYAPALVQISLCASIGEYVVCTTIRSTTTVVRGKLYAKLLNMCISISNSEYEFTKRKKIAED